MLPDEGSGIIRIRHVADMHAGKIHTALVGGDDRIEPVDEVRAVFDGIEQGNAAHQLAETFRREM